MTSIRDISPKEFLIDFDGTIAYHDYPYIEKAVPHAVRVLKRMEDAGHRLILHTCRADDEFEHAKAWIKDQGLTFFAFNCNPNFESGSRKVYGHWHIDDHNLGSPIIEDPTIHRRAFVDWLAIEKILEEKGLL